MAEKSIREQGGIPTFKGYNGYAASICASVNSEVVHGVPGDYVLREGDILSIDIGTTFEGYVSDTAVSIPIGNVSEDARTLMRVTQECLMRGIAQMREGNLPRRYRPCDSGARASAWVRHRAHVSGARRRPENA